MTHTRIQSVGRIMIASFIFIVCMGYANTSHAYFTTAQREITLGNGTGLFLIEYVFGMETHEVFLPISAKHTNEKKPSTVEFTMLDKNNAVAQGKVKAMVLSHADITQSGMYHTKKGTAEKFTLAVFFTPETRGVDEYHLQVTSLPFNFDGTMQLQLNPSELVYYTSDSLAL